MTTRSRSETVVRRRITALSEALPLVTDGDVEAVHQARVASRRLREVLPIVLAPGGRTERLRRTVRRLTRTLGPVRELDVALATLDELEAANVPKAAIRQVRRALLTERGEHQKTLRKYVRSDDVRKLEKRTLRAVHHHAATSITDLDERRRVARRRAIVRARTLRAAIRDAAGLYLPDRLHEVRLAVKKLRYALEAVAELQRRRPSKALLTLKQAQDLLGRMHDFEVLIARTRAVQGAAKVSTLRESSALDQMVRHLEHACRQMHADYVAQRTALLDVCDHAEQRAAANQDKRARKAARGKDATHRKKG